MSAKIGVIHYNFPGFTFDDFLKYAAETGYGYVELQSPDVWPSGAEYSEQTAVDVRKQVEGYGLKVSALAAQNDFVVLEEETVVFQVERMKKICRLAQVLGTNVIRSEGGAPKESVPETQWVNAMAGCFSRLADFIMAENMKLAVDNHGVVTNDGDLQLRLFEKVGCPNLGANMDTMNYRWFGHDIATINRFYDQIAPYAFHTHMKDGTGSRNGYVGASLGKGEIDLQHALGALRKAGYDGVYCAEYEGREGSEVGYRNCCEWLKANA